MSAVVSLIAGRARAYAAQWALVAVGVAIATSVPVLTSASTRVASTGALEHGLAALPVGQRSVTVSYYGFLSGTELANADAVVRKQLDKLTQTAPLREMVFRRLSDGRGGQLTLAAVDDLPRAVRLVSGRLPTSCTPRSCEVVVVGPTGKAGAGATPYTGNLGVVVVGRVERVNPLLFSGTFDPGADAPLLLGANTEQMAASSVLENFFRSWGWVAPLDLQLVGQLGVERYLTRSNDVADALFRRPPGLVLTAPDDVLRDEDDRANRSGQRFALLGGTSAALVLGLAIVAAVSARRDHLAVIRLLLTRGATPAQLTGFSLAEATWPSLLGAAVGVAAAYAGALAFWDSSVAAAGLTGGLATSAMLAAVAVAAVGLTLRWSPSAGERAAWQAVNVAVVATVAAALLAASRGSTGVETGASPDALVTLLPVLTSLAGGLLAARCWPFVPRLLGRMVPRRAAGFRLALADAGRRPLRAAATVAVLAATSASVVFAIGYRSTLDRGAAEQAAYAVPMVARLTTGPALVRPADLAAGRGVSELGGATFYPVLRAVGSLSVSSGDSAAVELLGLTPSALPRVAHWRSDYAGVTPAAVRRRLTIPAPVRGPAIPNAAKTLVVPVTGSTSHLEVVALVRDGSGRSLPIALPRRDATLIGALPTGSERSLDSIVLREDTLTASLRQHAVGESGLDLPARTGRVVFGHPTADGQALDGDVGRWAVSTPGRGESTTSGLAVDYRIAGNTTTAHPPHPAIGPIPAYVDRATAAKARGGLLSLRLSDGRQLPLRVVASGERFPTTHGRFAVVDRASLASVMDDMTPGAGTSSEVWVWSPEGDPTRVVTKGLGEPPFDRLAVALRPALEQSLRSDPVALTSSRLLLGTALVGLLVGGLCVVLMVLAERRESAGELFAREADGTRPGRLRVELLARAGAVLAVGVPVGVAAGIVLARATTTLVTVTAGGTTPQPPLVDAASPVLVAAALVALLGFGLLGAAGVAAASLRGPLPIPPGTDLR